MPNWSTRRTNNPKPKEDLPEFDENFMSLLRQIMPEGVIPTGWPLYRVGGSYKYWTTAGGNNYVPTGFTQIGAYTWSGAATSHARAHVFFARKYAGSPLVWVTIIDTIPDTTYSVCMASPHADGFWLDWWSQGYGDLTQIRFAWLAMGPGSAS